MPGTSMISTTSYGSTISSVMWYFSRSFGFSFRSRSAAKSVGASEGTQVTIPVPFVMLMVSSGSVYTFSYLRLTPSPRRYMQLGALIALPSRSSPDTSMILFTLPSSAKRPWYAMLRALRSLHTYTSPFFISNTP